ncbi:MAG: energy-coupled thiamine transporter ThiT [Sarcina sp.]
MIQYNDVVGQIGIVNIIVYVLTIVCAIIFGVAFTKKKPSLRKMIVIALFSAMAFVLSFIKIWTLPQGGSINMLPMLPVMLIAVLYGTTEGITCGLIYGILTLITGGHIVSIAEALLDYIFACATLGLAGIVGRDKKWKILIGAIIAVFLSVFSNIISGVYFYGMYAPAGMNLWWYSIVYNFSTVGIVGVLSIVGLIALPIERLKKQIKI